MKNRKKEAEKKPNFSIVLSQEAKRFLELANEKTREKILKNMRTSTIEIDNSLFKKLSGTNIWEFRTKYEKKQYRLLAFWDKDKDTDQKTLVIVTNGFITKDMQTPPEEIETADNLRVQYFNQKINNND